MKWLIDNKDLVAVFVSLGALLLSVWSTKRTIAANARAFARQEEFAADSLRTQTFQRVHEALIDPRAAKGRRLLFEADSVGRFPELGDVEWDEVNYSLALYDTLGGYLERGEVSVEATLDAWHHPLRNIEGPVANFMAHRLRLGVSQPWTFLHALIGRAKAYECACDQIFGGKITNELSTD